jgi:hypothetical protein
MILIQIILIIVFLTMGVNFIGSRNSTRTKAVKKLFLLLTIPCAVFMVLFPSISTDLAHIVGVGRGADLLLYGLTVTVIFQLFDSYVKSRQEQRRIVVLTRKIAIMEARAYEDKQKSKSTQK